MAVAHYLDALAWQRQVVQLQTIFGGKNPHPNVLVGGAPSAISVHAGAGTGTTAVNEVGLQKVARDHRADAQLRRSGLCARHAGDRLVLQRLVQDRLRRRHREFHDLWRFSGSGQSGPEDLSGAARRDSRVATCRTSTGGRPHGRGGHPGIRGAFLVRLQRRQGSRLASLPRRDPIELFGAAAALRASGHLGELFLAQVAALEGPRHGGRAAGARAHAVRERSRADQGARQQGACATRICRSKPCFRPWAAPPPARSSARSSPMPCRSGTTASWRTSRPATCAPSTTRSGSLRRGRGMRRAWDSWRRPAAPWRTGSSSTTARSQTIRRWCRARGMRVRAMRPASKGPYEAALKGHSVQDPKQPLEILRTIHSFDPCLACAVHVVDPDGEELIRVRVQ